MKLFSNVVSIDFEKSKDVYMNVYSPGFSEHSTHNFSIIVIKIIVTHCSPLSEIQNLDSARI